MSGSGRVVAVERRNEPKTNRPVLLLVTDVAAPIGPDHRRRNAVFIAEPGEGRPRPVVGDPISWGASHVEWAGRQLRKLGNECDPGDPALYTG